MQKCPLTSGCVQTQQSAKAVSGEPNRPKVSRLKEARINIFFCTTDFVIVGDSRFYLRPPEEQWYLASNTL